MITLKDLQAVQDSVVMESALQMKDQLPVMKIAKSELLPLYVQSWFNQCV